MGSEPSWWYGPPDALAPRLLQPAARLYASIAARRAAAVTPYRARLPVICVGNFTAGGTGKTPFAQMLVERLSARGARPAILSRGYGGRTPGPHWVDASRDGAALVGDEPLLIAASAPVMVCRNRAAGAKVIETDARAFTHIVMDDGLQNPSLAKTLSIALVDGARGFGNGAVIPAGPLRAPLAAQLPRVDAIVVNRGHADPARPLPIAEELGQTFTGPVLSAEVQPRFDATVLQGKPVVAFAGIGVPQRFFDVLDRLGLQLAARHAFGDHHVFTEAEALALLDEATRIDAALVTTEKDLARLAGADGACGRLRRATHALPIRLAMAERDQHRLDALLAPLL